MKTVLSLEEMEELIHPEKLSDVLESLRSNGLLESYGIDYRNGTVIVTLPLNVEVAQLMAEVAGVIQAEGKGHKGESH